MKTMPLKRPALLMAALAVASVLSLCLGTGPGAAQDDLFAPRLTVNGRVITNYEYEQRVQFLKLLRAPGDTEKQAMDALIEDKLRLDAAKIAGVTATPEQVAQGMTEFAGRANLSTEDFIKAIGEAGVAPETFRDFVEAGLLWREVVRAKFGALVRPTSVEVDRALTNMTRSAAVRVLLSEIIIPAEPGQEADALALAARLQGSITTEGGFAAAAREYSAAGSAARGGAIDWMPLANLPPALAPMILALGPGEVSQPMPIPNAVALFQLRAVEETEQTAPNGIQVEYAELYLPNDAASAQTAATIRGRVDTCDDLYTAAKGVPADQLRRETKPMAEVPQDVALELARLDAGETSTTLQGGVQRFLMLCSRRPMIKPPPARNEVGSQLVNQKLSGLADNYLADLRANAIIREP